MASNRLGDFMHALKFAMWHQNVQDIYAADIHEIGLHGFLSIDYILLRGFPLMKDQEGKP